MKVMFAFSFGLVLICLFLSYLYKYKADSDIKYCKKCTDVSQLGVVFCISTGVLFFIITIT